VTAAGAVSPELVLVDPELAAALRETAVAAPSIADGKRRPAAASPAPEPSVRRMTMAALGAVAALLLLQESAGSPEERATRSSAALPILLPPIAAGRTDASPRPLSTRRASVRHAPQRLRRRPPAAIVSWPEVQGADYYDLVLWRDGHRVLDLWPRAPRQALSRVPAGRYLWFAYPGFGSPSSGRFGKLAGAGSVLVRKSKNS
jgi:hypothetical protein